MVARQGARVDAAEGRAAPAFEDVRGMGGGVLFRLEEDDAAGVGPARVGPARPQDWPRRWRRATAADRRARSCPRTPAGRRDPGRTRLAGRHRTTASGRAPRAAAACRSAPPARPPGRRARAAAPSRRRPAHPSTSRRSVRALRLHAPQLTQIAGRHLLDARRVRFQALQGIEGLLRRQMAGEVQVAEDVAADRVDAEERRPLPWGLIATREERCGLGPRPGSGAPPGPPAWARRTGPPAAGSGRTASRSGPSAARRAGSGRRARRSSRGPRPAGCPAALARSPPAPLRPACGVPRIQARGRGQVRAGPCGPPCR